MNLARAIGPALAGILIAAIGVGALFALNAATFLFYGLVVTLWRPGPDIDLVVSSWAEHLRQHREQLTATDLAYEEQAKALSDPAPQTWHLLAADLDEG